MAKVLNTLADEIEEKRIINSEDRMLLKKIGSAILFQGVKLGYKTKPLKITHLYSEEGNYESSFSLCGTQLDGVGMQGRVIQGTDNPREVTCKKCIRKIKKHKSSCS